MENKTLYKALEMSRGQAIVESPAFQVGKDTGGVYNCINLSDAVTLLIKEVGRLCDSYASDLFYDLRKLYNDLEGENTVLLNQDIYQWVIGIRDMGCDHDNFLDSALRQGYDLEKRYRAVYEVSVTHHEKWKDEFVLKVYKINLWTLESRYKALMECTTL